MQSTLSTNDANCFSGVDSLMVEDWGLLGKIADLLEPFADETNRLQNDAQSLSSIVPSLLNLEAHLEQWQGSKELAKVLIRDFRNRFDSVLKPDSENFNPVPAAACILENYLIK